jgi:hypothetical protein
MRDYEVLVKVTWSNGVAAKTPEEAVKFIKDLFYDDYGLTLTDEEIISVEDLGPNLFDIMEEE